MNHPMKTRQVVEVCKVLDDAKISKMEDKDKFLVIKAMRQLKPVSRSYEEFVKEAREKLKGDDFEELRKKAEQWQAEGENTSLSIAERQRINAYFAGYTDSVNACVREEEEKDNEFAYERLSEEAFGKLIASNDFDIKTIMSLQEALMKES